METSATAAVDGPKSVRGRGSLYALLVAGVVLLVGFGLYWNRHSVNGPVEAALVGETDAVTSVYKRSWFGGNDIVFDIESTTGEMSMASMTRMLLKSAEALKETEFNRVYLAHKGREKFYLEGSYFKRLGEEREWQNPIYTIRTMPENVHNLDGSQAFQSWSGGWLGVMGQQLNDNNELHRKWWVDDELSGS